MYRMNNAWTNQSVHNKIMNQFIERYKSGDSSTPQGISYTTRDPKTGMQKTNYISVDEQKRRLATMIKQAKNSGSDGRCPMDNVKLHEHFDFLSRVYGVDRRQFGKNYNSKAKKLNFVDPHQMPTPRRSTSSRKPTGPSSQHSQTRGRPSTTHGTLKQPYQSRGSANGRQLHVGSRGGVFSYSNNGNRVYHKQFSSNNRHQSQGTANGRPLHVGPRGGVFHLTTGGNRVYHDRSQYCGNMASLGGGYGGNMGGGPRCKDGSLDMRCAVNRGRDKWG